MTTNNDAEVSANPSPSMAAAFLGGPPVDLAGIKDEQPELPIDGLEARLVLVQHNTKTVSTLESIPFDELPNIGHEYTVTLTFRLDAITQRNQAGKPRFVYSWAEVTV